MAQPPEHIPRLVVAGGTMNVERVGLKRNFGDVYHYLLRSSWPRLLSLIITLYIAVNLLFAWLYLAIPDSIENARPGSLVDAFFFSVQTMATIGYGRMVPHTVVANVMVTVEALIGLLGLAMITGLLFAKFSRPTARVLFSRVATITVRDGAPSLTLRMANERGNQIVEAQLRLVLARNEVTKEGENVRRFYDLPLVRERNVIFALTWTAVSPITEKSALWGATAESLRADKSEIICSLMGIDDTFSQTVHVRHSYLPDEVIWHARFVDILSVSPAGRRVVNYQRFHDVQPHAPPS